MKLAGISSAEFPSCPVLLCIALALCFNQVSSTTNQTDKLALLAFKASITRDPFCMLNSWNNSIEFCQWYGVTCGRRHRRVTVLDLQSQGLSGSISPHIGNLSFLKKMRLQNNSLDHAIPPQIGQLHRLRILLLHNNSLVGEIPKNISGCLDLLALWVLRNELTGEIPRKLSSLTKLQDLVLHVNNLTGNLPSFIGNLSSLEKLSLGGNNLGGSIPQVLGHLTNLQFLLLSFNILSGTIPPSLFNLSSLLIFSVGLNQIQGTLPIGMGLKLPKLEIFDVGDNQLEGPIPPSISNYTELRYLCIDTNGFSGKLPSLGNLYKLRVLQMYTNQVGSGKPEDLSFLCSLTNITKLEEVNIGFNKFGGVLPKCLGNLSTTLNQFSTAMNQISGEIPEEIGNLVNLEVLFLNFNQLSGVIPSNLGNLQNLKKLGLSRNNLRGTIPSSLGNLTEMINLDLSGNNFHGQIPSRISKCRSLNKLDLSYNNLSGAIPPHLIGLSSLAILLCLSHNYLTGILPTEVGNLRALTALDISDNLLVGEIPNSLGDCTSLVSLRMEGNFFHGSIPQSIKSLGGIGELDLSRNNLSGQIPEFLAVFQSLERLNLSYNKFEGMLPCEGVFKNATSTSIVGNNELCGGLPEFHLPNCISKSLKSRKINIVIVVASTISGVVGMALIAAFIYLCWVKKKVNEPVSSSMDDSHLNVSYGTLLKATEGFSSANLIGVGGFGSVYRGILNDNGTVVAVKVLHLVCRGALNSFIVEYNQMSSMGLRGTVGYAPPEYATGCKVSREGDVYSFGILLLEIFTGLSPTDDKFRDNLTLHSFVTEALPERVLEITDSFLLQEIESHLGSYSRRHWSSEGDNIFQECLVMVYNIGVACSYQVPRIRMSINEAANQLHRIRKKLFALGLHERDEPPIA
ncbi:putative receptor-like protein kinase At3g47110 [Eucalyptus grandis]|uniref:putative receptor-like protein kinase At3g47110 n=1 Tax=Eucalyptus grandis TaxID=71139 RepID=UPI00192E87FD|nr:putative receptor-like protein kinase At3g47110 [Eucalyptus grandis]